MALAFRSKGAWSVVLYQHKAEDVHYPAERGSARRGMDQENKCEEWNNTKSPRSHNPNASCLIVESWVITDRLQGVILKRRNYPAVGGTRNAACYETGIGNRQRPLLEVKTQSAFVPWYSEERGTMKAAVQLTGQANEFCSSVNSRKTNFVGQRKFSMSMFKLFGQSKCRFSLCSTETEVLYSLLKFFYVSLVLTAFYNSLRHSLL